MLNEDAMIAILSKVEKLAGDLALAKQAAEFGREQRRSADRLRNEVEELRSLLTAAENKVGEWREWYDRLRHHKTRPFLNQVPVPPKPLETQIPF